MANFFSATIDAVLSGRTVAHAILVHLDFLSDPKRIWLGAGGIAAGGYVWQGLGELAAISDLEMALGDKAPVVTYSLSGVDPALVAEGIAASTDVKGRSDEISIQFFDAATLATLDSPYVIRSGVMDTIKVKATGPTQRTVEVTSELLFTRRGMPLFGWLTTADQTRRFPGDRGLEQVPQMVFQRDHWPVF